MTFLNTGKIGHRICQQLAEMHANSREWNKAIELFKEAIGNNERDIKVGWCTKLPNIGVK